MKGKKRILIVDDNEDIHFDFHNILASSVKKEVKSLEEIEQELFEESDSEIEVLETWEYIIDDAFDGAKSIEMIETAHKEGFPYSVVYMDIRMPPGMDGVTTTLKILEKYPLIEFVLCTAFSDYSWEKLVQLFGMRDNVFFLRKPFDTIAIKQTTLTLATKWELNQLDHSIGTTQTKKVKDFLLHLSNKLHQNACTIINLCTVLKSNTEFVKSNDSLSEMLEKTIKDAMQIDKALADIINNSLSDNSIPTLKRIK